MDRGFAVTRVTREMTVGASSTFRSPRSVMWGFGPPGASVSVGQHPLYRFLGFLA